MKRNGFNKGLLRTASLVLLLALVLAGTNTFVAYANTFVGPSTITIDGTFTDWGTAGSPVSGAYPYQDASNSGEQDGTGFKTKPPDMDYFWSATSTQSGGDTVVSPSNPIQNFYYRFDLFTLKNIDQAYNIQLNLGTATTGYADHVLQVYVDAAGTPQVTLVLYQYDTPYPEMQAFTTGSLTGVAASVASPYPSFTGTVDANAQGALGIVDGVGHIEVNIPVDWFGSTYGGSVAADGSGATAIVSAVFTSSGGLGSVGTVKDTLNNASGTTIMSSTDTTDGDTDYITKDITQIAFTTSAQSITAGSASSVMTIQTRDATGAPKNVSADTTIDLTSTSGNGLFSLNATPWSNITSVTITNGTNSANFYYKDSTVGTPTITAAENPDQSWTDATQQETITASPLSLDAVALYDSTETNPVTNMDPQVEYAVKVTVTDGSQLSDLNTVEVTLYYDADGTYNAGEVPTSGNTQTCAILTCTVGATPGWAIDPSASTTWTIESGNCVQPTLTNTTGDFWFHFKPGKVANESASPAKWHIYAEADTGSLTATGYQDNRQMNWYAEVTVNTASIVWSSIVPGTDFGDTSKETGISNLPRQRRL